MRRARYKQIYDILKSGIQQSTYPVGSYLPSEHELCRNYGITRTTARKALDELSRDQFIEKQHGKGSRVKERSQSLGLLKVKGFSEAVDQEVNTIFLQYPQFSKWPECFPFHAAKEELASTCIRFERLRCVGDYPVMLESSWFSAKTLDGFLDCEFVGGSFFKTLSQKFFIEIKGSEQELQALSANQKVAKSLNIDEGMPVLQIDLKFSTSNADLNIYSRLFCNTEKYPVGNMYRN